MESPHNLCPIWPLVFYALAYVQMICSNPIEVASVGRVAKLGEFYDVRSDQFLRLNLFKNVIPNSTITLTENKETKLKYTLENTYEGKFDTMDISAELQLSIMGGFITLKGSGGFFKDTKKSAKSAKATLVQSFSVAFEQVSLLDTTLQESLNLRILSQTKATHVVVGIQWGGHIFLSVQDENEDNHDVQKVEGSLGVDMKIMAAQISGSGHVNITDADEKKFSRFSFDLYGDIVPETVPQTIEEALQFMKTSPHLLLAGNNGKGAAVKYVLLPLDELKRYWEVKMNLTNVIEEIDAIIVNDCVKLFDRLQTMKQELNDITVQATSFKNQLSSTKMRAINSMDTKLDNYLSKFTANLSLHTLDVRTGKVNISDLINFMGESKRLFKKYWNQENRKRLTEMKQEIIFLNLLRKDNVTLFIKDQTFGQLLYEHFNRDLYVFFYNYYQDILRDQTMINLKNLVINRKNESDLFFAVNYDVMAEEKFLKTRPKVTKISVYRDGKLIADNYPENQTKLSSAANDLFSLHLQRRIEQLEKKTDPPLGFIYVQFPMLDRPEQIWPGTRWKNLSPNYNGSFFRTEGGEASTFGEVQKSSYPKYYIDQYENSKKHDPDWNLDRCFAKACPMNQNGWSDWVFTGCDYGVPTYIRHKTVTINNEVRPENMAIRIWQKI